MNVGQVFNLSPIWQVENLPHKAGAVVVGNAMRRGVLLACCLLVSLVGCTRGWYRRDADKETYNAVGEHMEPTWYVPNVDIVPPPESRLYDPYSPDFPPMPPDDPAAHQYMLRANGIPGYKHWYKDGVAPSIEDSHWLASLPLEQDGTLLLNQERAVELGVLNSREYQRELENVYLIALALTLNRFEFDLHWYLTNATTYQHIGNSSVPTESNTLTTNTTFGFTRNLAIGGQVLVNFANSFVWEYTGRDSNFVMSGISFNIIQPLLRGAGKDIRMESLTQAERDLLYTVRDFARFRKQFYVNTTAQGNGYLSLLLQVQNIRNLEANLQSLEQSLRLHDALFISGEVSVVQVDQVFQSYQQGKAQLLQARTNLANSLDTYKISLGLPPGLPVKLDDALLDPFQLNSKEITALQDELEKSLLFYQEMERAPSLEQLRAGYERLVQYHKRAVQAGQEVRKEYEEWLGRPKPAQPVEPENKRDKAAQELLARQLAEVEKDLPPLRQLIERDVQSLSEAERTRDWERLQRRLREEISQVSQLFVIQTQIRVSRLDLPQIDYHEDTAVSYALENRLDFMNDRARVTDAWRQIKVTANALEGVMNVTVGGNINTAPDASNPFDFAAIASSYRVGLQLEGPLNRLAERNAYRASLINYQRRRRDFMAREDQIVQAIRRDLRQLETDRLNFIIARQSLISAARQVEASRERLRLGGDANPATGTLDILNALNTLLQAKNSLIAVWVNYESGRLQLLLDMEMMQLDERGLFRDVASFRPDGAADPGNQRPDRQP
jgi:outer membrane protein TolC